MAKKVIRIILALILGLIVGFLCFFAINLLITYMVTQQCPAASIPCITSSPWGILALAFSNTGLLWVGLWMFIFYKVSARFIR